MEDIKHIAIVEDDLNSYQLLEKYLKDYVNDKNFKIQVFPFHTALEFKNSSFKNFDIIFMDIELPDGNGMELAEELRKENQNSMLIFVTNLAQYAINGYSVNAFDFILKPINYYSFVMKMDAAFKHLNYYAKKELIVKVYHNIKKVDISSIKYIEISNHSLTFYTVNETFKITGSLKSIEKELSPQSFAMCNQCYLVNLKYVTEIKDFIVYLGNDKLLMSRPKRKSFLQAFNNYLGY